MGQGVLAYPGTPGRAWMAWMLSETEPLVEHTGMCAGTNSARPWLGSVTRSSSAVTRVQAAGRVLAVSTTRSTACAVAPGASMTGFGRTERSRTAGPPICPPASFSPATGLSW